MFSATRTLQHLCLTQQRCHAQQPALSRWPQCPALSQLPTVLQEPRRQDPAASQAAAPPQPRFEIRVTDPLKQGEGVGVRSLSLSGLGLSDHL